MSQCPNAKYQSPINLEKKFTLPVCQKMSIKGYNEGAIYNSNSKIFVVRDKVILKIDSKLYHLVEYHFHVAGEHTICKKEYPAEIHYVFFEMKHNNDFKTCNGQCVCDSSTTIDETILVIGRVIRDTDQYTDLTKLQVKIPSSYFEYDGTLTGQTITDMYTPVRWFVGENSIKLPVDQIKEQTKTSKPISSLDNRIILYSS